MSNNSSNLTISDLKLWIHLGCSDQEKYHPQLVSFDILIDFFQNPQAVLSDKLEDSVCYANITNIVKETISNKKYNLIEYLAANTYDEIIKHTGNKEISLTVTVKKLSPPVKDIHGYVSFTYKG